MCDILSLFSGPDIVKESNNEASNKTMTKPSGAALFFTSLSAAPSESFPGLFQFAKNNFLASHDELDP